jgi:hypothetical protein
MMDDLLKNKFVWIVGLFTVLNLCVFVGGKIVVNKAATQVIERLRQDYSPSPYGPGLDPDKLQPRQSQQQPPQPQQPKAAIMTDEQAQKTYLEMKASQDPVPAKTMTSSQQWREDWERERGFSSSQ